MSDVLRYLWDGWKIIARKIGHFQTRLVLSLLYFVVLSPVAVLLRILGDPLGLRQSIDGAQWRARDFPVRSLEQARRQ